MVCLGVGGLVDLEEVLGLDGQSEDASVNMKDHGVEVWVIDARRPWNLQNVFGSGVHAGEDGAVQRRQGVEEGRLLSSYRPGGGGVMVWDDGDIASDLAVEKEAFMALQGMPEITEDDMALEGAGSDDEEEAPSSSQGRKRKASNRDSDDETEDYNDEPPQRRRRSNSSTPIPSSPGGNPTSAQLPASMPPPSSQPSSPSAVIPSSPPTQPSQRQLRRRLLKLRRKHEATLEAYYNLGTSYAEPVSSMLYSLASELGREDNDLLWLAIVGISSVESSPYSQAPTAHSHTAERKILNRAEQIRGVLRDEVRRLNPIPDSELRRQASQGDLIPTHARSPTDTAIRLSPEPRFQLIRHWSLYDSMLHSSYLATRLHVWSDGGRKRLHKLLAKMGISLQEAGKGYIHMDMELKRSLRKRILRFAAQYNLDGLVPADDGRLDGWSFVRSWGWKATLSALDVATVVGAILEVGTDGHLFPDIKYGPSGPERQHYNSRVRNLPTPPHSSDDGMADAPVTAADAPDWTTHRFFAAYDALSPTTAASTTQGLSVLLSHIPTAQHLSRAILRTGSALIAKKQIRHLRAFRMGVVKEGPDVSLFCHPGALVKLAGWVAEAVAVLEAEKGRRQSKDGEALVLGCLDENRGVYVVVGLGGGGAGRRVRSKAEVKEREDRSKRKEAARTIKKAEKATKKLERRRLRREMNEANGIIDSDDEDDGHGSDSTESASSSSSGSGSDSEDEEMAEAKQRKGYGLNRFGQSFQEVVEETGARVRIDSFEHSVVEVKKEDLAGFLEALSLKSVVG